MRPSLLLLVSVPLWPYTLAAVPNTHGVHPRLLSRYAQPSNNAQWSCLDGSMQIPWHAINDDYCDCPDGSDEPGTGACPHTLFYCVNKGHIGSNISSTKVNDGLCEPECCDGSDEPSGTCPNLCAQVGQVYREQMAQDQKLRKTGSKIRASYITFAQKEKKRLEALIVSTAPEIAIRQKEVTRLKALVDRTEALSAAALEHKKMSPLYTSLESHSELLESLLELHEEQVARIKTLEDILDSLRTGYNPNYQDMAVLEAVRGWEQVAGLPHINDVGKDNEPGGKTSEDSVKDEKQDLKVHAEEIKEEVGKILATDYISLLVEHDNHVGNTAATFLIFDISAYLPDFMLDKYEALTSTIVSFLRTIGVVSPVHEGDFVEAGRARQSLTEAESALDKVKKMYDEAQADLKDLFDPEAFGKQGEWKKLQGTCVEKDTGEYTYEVCFFGGAKQKPNKGGSNNDLGHYASWNPDTSVQVGTPEYYAVQSFREGAQCWNGPRRSVNLHLSCGIENELLSVSEPEKCEYMFVATTPALCVVEAASREDDGGKKDEL